MKYTVQEQAPKTFVEESGLHPVIATMLWNRGIKTREEAEVFLNPSWEKHIHDPFLFSNMRRAVERINHAIRNDEKIVIHGDYDADGVTGSAVLFETLSILSAFPSTHATLSTHSTIPKVYIPHRENEGYGLRMSTVDKLKEQGTKLIITVDCGIASVTETDYAHSLGIDTIIVDHHAMPPELSKTAIIIHPHVPGETYPFKPLAAVGVAFKVACALITDARTRGITIPIGFEKWLLDFVAIATVTDIVPLIGENRVLETFGLKVLQKTRREGFRALYRVAGIDPEKIDTTTIGFGIGPRINAAGRMKHAKLAFETLTAKTIEEADLLAAELQQANVARQKETEKMVEVALEKAKAQKDEKVICLAEDGWPHGLVGLVASKLTNTFNVPAYVVGKTERGLVGSGRSIPGFHVTEALKKFSDCLSRFGGHPQACGFSVKDEAALVTLFAGLHVHAREMLIDHSTEFLHAVDAMLTVDDCTLALAEHFARLEPFGEGNHRPLVLVENVIVQNFTLLGKEQNHLKIHAATKTGRMPMIAFKQAHRMKELALGTKIDVIGEFSINEWQGRREPQVIVKDFDVKS